ncbi:MAG TPA: pyrroloquinoline quinone biosynthesis peptide chaperone PqqD [Acidobacteriaceae bacterium]|nr:pyrroloquinoline quinone biosynthesis peptide chaperone PqqD [Acidobacteriaceae bacterium]
MDLTAVPRLSAGCRLHRTEPILLIPEGALKLAGPARELLLQVDGSRSVAEIIGLLAGQYPAADRSEIERDVVGVLDRMQQRGVIRVN